MLALALVEAEPAPNGSSPRNLPLQPSSLPSEPG